VPANKLSSEFNSFVSKYSTTKTDPNAPVPLTIGLGGTFSSPSPKLMMDEQKAQVKEAVTNAAKEEGTKALEKAVKGTEAEKVLNNILGKNKKDSTKTADSAKAVTPVPANKEEVKKKVEDEAKKKIQNLLKKKN